MEIFDKALTKKEIDALQKSYGDYLKLTIDVEKEIITAGMKLHADGEKILLNQGSKQENIWGGGINLKTKQIDFTAVLNIRPRFDNDSLEILDPKVRQKFRRTVEKIFQNLWG